MNIVGILTHLKEMTLTFSMMACNDISWSTMCTTMGGRHISFSCIGKYLKHTVQILSVEYFSLNIQLAVGCWSYLLDSKSHMSAASWFVSEVFSFLRPKNSCAPILLISDNNLRTLHGGHIIDQQTLIHHFFEPTILFLIFLFIFFKVCLSIISYVQKNLAHKLTAEGMVYCTRTNAIKTSPDTKLWASETRDCIHLHSLFDKYVPKHHFKFLISH